MGIRVYSLVWGKAGFIPSTVWGVLSRAPQGLCTHLSKAASETIRAFMILGLRFRVQVLGLRFKV